MPRFQVLTTFTMTPEGRDRLAAMLQERGIEASPVSLSSTSNTIWDASTAGEIREALDLMNARTAGLGRTTGRIRRMQPAAQGLSPRAGDVDMGAELPLKVQIRSDQQFVYARAGIQTLNGPVYFEVRASRRAMEALCRQWAQSQGMEVGSIFSWVKKAAKRLARLDVVRKALAMAKKVTDLPVLGDLMPPTVRAAIRAAAAATEATAALRSGNPRLQAEARQVISRAQQRAGVNPAVARALQFAARLTQTPAVQPPRLPAPAPVVDAEQPY